MNLLLCGRKDQQNSGERICFRKTARDKINGEQYYFCWNLDILYQCFMKINLVILMHHCRIFDPCQRYTLNQLNFCVRWPDLFWDWDIIRAWGFGALSRCQIHHSWGIPQSICLRCKNWEVPIKLVSDFGNLWGVTSIWNVCFLDL